MDASSAREERVRIPFSRHVLQLYAYILVFICSPNLSLPFSQKKKQPSQKTFKIKKILGKKQKQNPIISTSLFSQLSTQLSTKRRTPIFTLFTLLLLHSSLFFTNNCVFFLLCLCFVRRLGWPWIILFVCLFVCLLLDTKTN